MGRSFVQRRSDFTAHLVEGRSQEILALRDAYVAEVFAEGSASLGGRELGHWLDAHGIAYPALSRQELRAAVLGLLWTRVPAESNDHLYLRSWLAEFVARHDADTSIDRTPTFCAVRI